MSSRAPAGGDPGPSSDLVAATARFGRLLRSRRVPVTVAETLTAVEALERLDLGDRREVYLGLRAVLTASPGDYAPYHEAFDDFWSRVGREAEPERRGIPRPSLPEPRPPEPRRSAAPTSLRAWLRQGEGEPDQEEPSLLRAPSSRESLEGMDPSRFGPHELEEVLRQARRLARRLARRSGRRWRADPRGSRIHMRRTVRRSLALGGESPELAMEGRRPRRRRFVALCDVSGSMDLYSRFFLQFLYALQHVMGRVESFVFATRLSRVTPALATRDFGEAVERLAREVRDFSGGTRIGECLEDFLARYPRLVDRKTVVLVLSDGWETGDPERLGRTLEEVGARAGRLIWLDPLGGRAGYQPVTRGMEAVLPRVEAVLPLHDLETLEALVERLAP